MNKNDKTISTYLNQIDSGPLLTRDQEEHLIKNVEVFQKEILNQLTLTKYSRNELKSYLQSLDSSGESIIDISKKLDDESSKDAIAEIEIQFKKLIKELSTENVEEISKLLVSISLTGTIIHGVVTGIKKKHSKILDIEFNIKKIRKYFGGLEDSQMISQIISNSEVLKERLRSDHQFSDVKISNHFNEWNQSIKDLNQETKSMSPGTFADVQDLYNRIIVFESQAKKYKDELIEKNLRLVISRAKKYKDKGLEFEDLIQEGNLGLMKAVDKFDSSKKTKVSTYATWWIDQSIRRALSNKGKTVRVPTHIEWLETGLNKIRSRLTGELGRPPTLAELAKESGEDLKTLEDLHNRAQHEIGLEEELSSGMSMIELLQSETTESPFYITEQRLLREDIREMLSTLPPRTEKIIRLRFGIGEVPDDEGITLQAIANQVGITKQGVRVVECAAFKILKKKAKRLVNE